MTTVLHPLGGVQSIRIPFAPHRGLGIGQIVQVDHGLYAEVISATMERRHRQWGLYVQLLPVDPGCVLTGFGEYVADVRWLPGLEPRNLCTNPNIDVSADGWTMQDAVGSLARVGVLGGAFDGDGSLLYSSGDPFGTVAAPVDIGMFEAGVTYYGQMDVAASFAGDQCELILGDRSGDHSSTVFTSGGRRTVEVQWTPATDCAYPVHGLRLRADSLANLFLIDLVSVSTSTGYVDGDRPGARWLGDRGLSVSVREEGS